MEQNGTQNGTQNRTERKPKVFVGNGTERKDNYDKTYIQMWTTGKDHEVKSQQLSANRAKGVDGYGTKAVRRREAGKKGQTHYISLDTEVFVKTATPTPAPYGGN